MRRGFFGRGWLGACALFCAVFGMSLVVCQAAGTGTTTGREFTLTNIDGKAHSLREYRGKVVVLNFWATWCLPCRDEMPMLSKLEPRYDAKDVVFLAASLDDAQTQAKIPHFLEEKKITLAVFTGATPEVLKQFDLGEIIPATLILDRDGTPVFRIEGEASKKDIATRLEWLLSERTGKQPKILVKNF
jgi:thiol-disulfide isomerase/thioredoxin